MTGFLASVKTAQEAQIALEAGATLIDAKNPHAGALGALPLEVIRDIVSSVDGRAPVSATAGDLKLDNPELYRVIQDLEPLGVTFIKIGIFTPSEGSILNALGALPRPSASKRIAVCLVDMLPWQSIPLKALKDLGFEGVMLDTAYKSSGGLRSLLSLEELQAFVSTARAASLLVGLAGKLSLDDIEPLVTLDADYLGFRSALCHGQARESTLSSHAAQAVSQKLRLATPVRCAQ